MLLGLGLSCACVCAHAQLKMDAPSLAPELLEPVYYRRADLTRLAAAPEEAGTETATSPSNGNNEVACEKSLRLPWGPIKTCKAAIVTTAVTSVAVFSMAAWWSNGFSTSFHTLNEGWFGPDTYSGGIDKLGHAFSFYVGTRLGTRALGWANVPHTDALALSAGIAFGVGLGIELLDGFSRNTEYGFSWQDLTMNAVGIGFAALAETYPAVDRYVAFRWLYSPDGRSGSWYDHHTYLLALRMSGFEAIGQNNPLRFVEFVAGYGAKGFRSDLDYSGGDTRERSLYFGVGLNLTEIFDRTLFAGKYKGGSAQAWTTEFLRYVEVPYTLVTTKYTYTP